MNRDRGHSSLPIAQRAEHKSAERDPTSACGPG